MSSDRIYGSVTFDCDLCDASLETGEEDFFAAVREKKAQGWTSRKDRETGEWLDVCDSCARK